MKKRFLNYLFSILAVSFATIWICLKMNQILPTMKNYQVLPMDIDEKGYVLEQVYPDENGLVKIEINQVTNNFPLALIINDMGSYIPEMSLFLNDTLIYSYDENEFFQRVHSIELDPNLYNDKIEIVIEATGWQSRTTEILTKKINASPQIIICTVNYALKIEKYCFGFMMALLAIASTIIINSFFVVLNRKKETAYCFLILLAAVRLFCMLIDISALPLTMQQYYTLHHAIVVVPAVLNTAVGVWLLKKHSKKYDVHFAKYTILLMFIALLFQYCLEYNWYHLIQLLGAILFFVACFKAACQNSRGWLVLCVGYTICFSIVAFLYSVNIWKSTSAGVLIICLNATNVSYLLSLMSCMIYISLHLTDKYNEAEQLTYELSEINQQLDLKVLERTEELVEAHKRQEIMMMNVFHDLRNPVFILNGYVEKIKGNAEIKNLMLSRLQHLQRLIDDLFLSEKLNSNEISMFKDQVELDELIKAVVEEMISEDIYIDLKLGKILIWADETRLIQIFENLLSNAIKYSDKKTNIFIEAYQSEDTAIILIKDQGIGIANKDIPHLFKRYYTCSMNKKSGTGLGLYITKMLVELHGGCISVESELNKGTCFKIQLPLLGKED